MALALAARLPDRLVSCAPSVCWRARGVRSGLCAVYGLGGHGLWRVALYCQHLKEGRANGKARPKVIQRKGATALVDAGGGLAFPACALAVKEAAARAKRNGVSFVGVTNSHHMGALGYHLMPLARAGMMGIAFTNAPSAINAWGGKRAFYGTNPIAAVIRSEEHTSELQSH